MENKQQEEWVEIGSSNSKIWDFNQDKEFVGHFTGVQSNVGANSSNLFSFKALNGEAVSIWGSSLLDSRLGNLIAGEKVKIVYQGKQRNPKSGREFKDFKVYHTMAKHIDNVLQEEVPVINEGDDTQDINAKLQETAEQIKSN